MEQKRFTLEVVTLKRMVFSDEIESLVAPGTLGYFGILCDHTPFVSSLQVGITTITKANDEKLRLATNSGFLMTDGRKVIVLVDTAEFPHEIDVPRAQAAKERAERRLTEKAEDIDLERARAALCRALARLKVVAN